MNASLVQYRISIMKLSVRRKVNFRNYNPTPQLRCRRTEIRKPSFPVIDAHLHLGPHYRSEPYENRYHMDELVTSLKESGIVHAVDLELFSEEFFYRDAESAQRYGSFFSFCMPADLRDFESPAFESRIHRSFIEMAGNENVCGIKIWKDLGLSLRRKNGSLARLTDPEFDVIWDTAKELDLPVVIHVADPPAFFQKPDTQNELLEELLRYPMWSYWGRKDVSFHDLIRQQTRLVTKNHEVTFVIAHMGSWASNLDYVDRLLERAPNVYVDTAAVLPEIGRQPRRFSETVRRYPNRILFGTDLFAGGQLPYEPFFRFMETEDEYFDYNQNHDLSNGQWKIYGAGLKPDDMKRIYYENASSVFHLC